MLLIVVKQISAVLELGNESDRKFMLLRLAKMVKSHIQRFASGLGRLGRKRSLEKCQDHVCNILMATPSSPSSLNKESSLQSWACLKTKPNHYLLYCTGCAPWSNTSEKKNRFLIIPSVIHKIILLTFQSPPAHDWPLLYRAESHCPWVESLNYRFYRLPPFVPLALLLLADPAAEEPHQGHPLVNVRRQ